MRPPYDAVLNELEHARTERARFAKERDEARNDYAELVTEAVIDEWQLETVDGKEWVVSSADFYHEPSEKPAIFKALKGRQS